MTSLRTKALRHMMKGPLVLMTGLLAAACQPATPDADPPLLTKAQTQDPQAEDPFEAFAAWAERAGRAPRSRSAAPADPEGEALARRRRVALLELMRREPQAALQKAVAATVRERLPSTVTQLLEQPLDAFGDLLVAVADEYDPATRSWKSSQTTHSVVIRGHRYKAHVFGRRLKMGSKQDIPLHGIILDDSVALSEAPARVLKAPRPGSPLLAKIGNEEKSFATQAAFDDFIAAQTQREAAVGPSSDGDAAVAAANPWTHGHKRILYIRVDFSDVPGEPLPAEAARHSIDVETNNFYRDNSYGRTSHSVTVTPVLRMPKTAASYVPGGDYSEWTLLTDAREMAAAAGYDTNEYELDIVAFGRIGYWWAGLAWVGTKGALLSGYFSLREAAHELGHNYGCLHANYWHSTDFTPAGEGYHVEYDNGFDIMGRFGDSPEDHFGVNFKQLFGWLQAGDVTTVTTSGTYRIRAHDVATSTGVRGLHIPINNRDHYVELRQRILDQPFVMNGAVITRGEHLSNQLIDMTPGMGARWEDAPLGLGQTFAEPAGHVYVTTLSKSNTLPATMDVSVQFGPFPSNRPPGGGLIASSSGANVGGNISFMLKASDPDGDQLAYHWDFGDNTPSVNSDTVNHTWSYPGFYVVRCVVSDMKGGTTSRSTLVSVGSHQMRYISGRVTAGGQPISDVALSINGWGVTYTDASGYYFATVYGGTHTLTPKKPGLVLSPEIRSVEVAGSSVSGMDFTAAAPAIRVDTGSPYDYYDSSGQRWSADYGFQGGTMYNRGPIEIEHTVDDTLYQTERFSMSGYAFDVPNGSYLVRMHFAETYEWITAAGQRVFHADVEGVTMPDIDVFASTGGRNRAHVRDINVKVTDGQLNIGFRAVKQNPMIQALEILPAQDHSAVRVDTAGDGSFTDSSGHTWSRDFGYDGGFTVNRGNVQIANTADDRIYQTERYSMTRYVVPVANGRHTVRLHFAETWDGITKPGQRVFHVNAEGHELRSLDIFALAGGRNSAVVRTFDVTVVDGQVDIGFTPVVQNPLINGIEVLPAW